MTAFSCQYSDLNRFPVQSLCDAENDLKKGNFDPILTQNWVIWTPILCFRGQITKITPKMDSLTQNHTF